jgi:hypothetical protein
MAEKAPQFSKGNQFICKALNMVSQFARRHGVNPAGRPGWSQTEDGWQPPVIRSVEGDPGGLWDLEVVDSDAGTVKIIRPGTIIKDFVDLSVALTVADVSDEWTVSSGHKIWIEITGAADAPVATMKSGSSWTDSPAPVTTTGTGGSAVFASYQYVLWEFISASSGETDVRVNESLFGRRVGQDDHFLRGGTTYHKEGDQPFWIHFLMPYHRVIAGS